MDLKSRHEAAAKRDQATSRAYRRGETRYVVRAITAGRRYSVNGRLVWARTCDNAMTTYIKFGEQK